MRDQGRQQWVETSHSVNIFDQTSFPYRMVEESVRHLVSNHYCQLVIVLDNIQQAGVDEDVASLQKDTKSRVSRHATPPIHTRSNRLLSKFTSNTFHQRSFQIIFIDEINIQYHTIIRLHKTEYAKNAYYCVRRWKMKSRYSIKICFEHRTFRCLKKKLRSQSLWLKEVTNG